MNMSSLTGKVAVITGGSRGIGLATARALVQQGAAVAITGTTAATLNAARDELLRDASADRVIAEPADVRDYAAVPHLRKRGGGWIINISSLASRNAFVNGAAYCASKSALNAFSESLMQEVRYEGIRVAYVLPGSVNTSFGGGVLSNTKAQGALLPDDVAQVIGDLVAHPSRSLPSRVEIRPSQPPRKV